MPAADPVPAEHAGIGAGVGDIDGRAVDADQPPVPVVRSPRRRRRQRQASPVEQLRQRLRPQPRPGLGDRDLTGQLVLLRATGPPQPLSQVAHHLLMTGRGEQRHRQHVVDRQMRRQQPVALLTPTRRLDDLIHQRSSALPLTFPAPGRPPRVVPDSTGREPSLSECGRQRATGTA